MVTFGHNIPRRRALPCTPLVAREEDRIVKPGVRLAVGIPQTFTQGPVDTGKIRAFVTRAEALGF